MVPPPDTKFCNLQKGKDVSTKKREYSQLDPDIRMLVATMNACGFRTYASCQGHGRPVDRLKPYVAFISGQAEAAALARRLRQDAESSAPELYWGWDVSAEFNSEFRLCYRLYPTGPHHWWTRYNRHSLRRDFSRIRRIIKLVQAIPVD